MYRIYLYKIGLLLYGGGMIALGIIVLAQAELITNVAAWMGALVIVIHGVHLLINYFFGKNQPRRMKKITTVIMGILNILSGAAIVFLPYVTINLLIFFFAFYILMNAVVKACDYLIYRKNNIKGRIYDLIGCLFFITFDFLIIFVPNMGENALRIVAGIYCILYGACQINDFIVQLIPRKTKNSLKRKIRISTPAFISFLMPLSFLRSFNSLVETGEIGKSKNPLAAELIEKKEDAEKHADMEIFIHISDNSVGRLGHCDLCIDGEVLSYGNYDAATMKLWRGLGDGIMFTVKKERYIRFSTTHDKKMIFCYGLRLGDEKMKYIKDEIAKLKSGAYTWKPPFQLAYEADKSTAKLEDFSDYCSKLWNGTRAHFMKFHEGRFKTYFVMSTNCVLLTDHIIGKAGADIVKINGIITPGTYFDYMEHEFLLEDSMVVSRRIYTAENTEEWQHYVDEEE